MIFTFFLWHGGTGVFFETMIHERSDGFVTHFFVAFEISLLGHKVGWDTDKSEWIDT